MPHAFFIGSKMACMRRLPPSAYGDEDAERPEDDDCYYTAKDGDSISTPSVEQEQEARPRYFFMPSLHLPQPFKMTRAGFDFVTSPRSVPMDDLVATEESTIQPRDKKKQWPVELQRPKPSLNCIKAHLSHACFDVAGSLLGFALVVNSAILILAAAVFYYGEGRSSNTEGQGISDLFDAYALVKEYLGQGECCYRLRSEEMAQK
jgi:metal iron transporter